MPSQEEYLDNLLKGIENENTENPEDTDAPEVTGAEEEPAVSEPAEESAPQIDMSDMDDLLQSALDAQKEDTAVHPEETANMSEDEIDRLLQKSQEQSEDAPVQGSSDANDDLIKMLENADDEGLSNILDQVTPETTQPEAVPEQPEEGNNKREKKRKKKEKEKKSGFLDRFKKDRKSTRLNSSHRL